MTRKYLPRLKVFLFALAITASATAAATIYCPAGFYCNDIYDECMSADNGVTPHGCALMRDRCYADACTAN